MDMYFRQKYIFSIFWGGVNYVMYVSVCVPIRTINIHNTFGVITISPSYNMFCKTGIVRRAL